MRHVTINEVRLVCWIAQARRDRLRRSADKRIIHSSQHYGVSMRSREEEHEERHAGYPPFEDPRGEPDGDPYEERKLREREDDDTEQENHEQ